MEKIITFGIVRIILLIFAALLLLHGVAYSLMLSRMNIGTIIQLAISAGIILYAVFLPKIPTCVNVIMGIICALPIMFALFLAIYGNTGRLSYDEDVVIVMGAGVINESVSRPLAYRLNTAIDYLRINENALVVVCGGLGDRATITEAEAMKRFLVARGIAPERIIKEDRSTNSFENLSFAKEILNEYFPDGFRAVLVTNDFHIFRTSYVASNIGITANRAGAPTPFSAIPSSYLREFLSIANVIVFPPWR